MTSNIAETVERIAKLDRNATTLIEALSELLRDEAVDRGTHGGLWRARVSLLELANGLRGARDSYTGTIMNGATRKLSAARDAIALVAADASPNDPNHAALEQIVADVGAVRAKVAAL